MLFKHTDVWRATFILLLAAITVSEGVSTQDTHIKHADQKAVINQSVTLSCHASVAGPVNWWYRSSPSAVVVELCVNGYLINGNRAKFILDSVSHSLTVPNPTFKDSGAYTCVENSGIGTRHVTELTVTVPLRQYQPMLVVAGQNVTVPCHSTTGITVNWQIKGASDALDKDLYVGGEFVEGLSIKYVVNPSTYDLTIFGVTSTTDDGIYTCVADSGFGTKHSTRLIVKASDDTENSSTTSPRDSTCDSSNNWSKTSIIMFTVIGLLIVLLASLVIVAAVMHMKVSTLRLRARRLLVEPAAGAPLLPITEDKATQKTVRSFLEIMGRKVDEAVQCTIGNLKKENRPSVLSVRFARQSSYDERDRQRHVSK